MAVTLRKLADTAHAQLALIRARWLLARRPIGTLTVRENNANRSPLGNADRAKDLATAVSRAAERGLFRPYCLVQAIALRFLLEREGIVGSEIRIGVRHRDGSFKAHAWIVWGDHVLGDDPAHVATFTEVDDIRVLAGS